MSGPRTPTGSGRGIALTIIANVGSLGIGLVTSVILARTLGPAGRGAYAAILTWPFVIGILGLLGVQQSAVYWTARQPGNARRIVTTGIALATVILAPVMLGAWLAMPFLLRAQGPSTVAAARAFVVVYGLASAGWLVTIGSMQGLRIFGAWNRVRVGQALLWMAMLSAAVALFPARPGPLSMLFAASYVVCIPWGLSTLSGASSGTWAPDFSLVRPLLRYGLASWSASVPTFLNRRLDQLAMAALVDPRILGLYAVAANMGILVTSVIASVANVALPHVATTADPEARRQFARRYIRFSVVAGLLCGGGMMVATPLLIPLVFGASFAPAIVPALILIPASVIQGVATVTEDILLGLDRARSVTWAEGIGLLVTGTGLVWTLPRFPLVGAAATLLVACSVVLFLVLRAASHHVGGSIHEFVVPTHSDWRDVLETARRLIARRN